MKKAEKNPFIAVCGAVKASPAALKRHEVLCEKCQALKSGQKPPPDEPVIPDPLHVTVIPPLDEPQPLIEKTPLQVEDSKISEGEGTKHTESPTPLLPINEEAIIQKAAQAVQVAMLPLFEKMAEKMTEIAKSQSPEAMKAAALEAVKELLAAEKPADTTVSAQGGADGGSMPMLLELVKLFKGGPQVSQPTTQMREMFGFMSEFMGTFMKAYNDGAQSASSLLSMGYKTGGDPALIAEGLKTHKLGPEIPTFTKKE